MLPLSAEPAFTVGELCRTIRARLERAFATRVRVTGEVSGCCAPTTQGHVYFALKDRDAQITCVCFRSTALQLGLRFPLEDGVRVEVLGRVSAYLPRGQYQIVVDDIVSIGRGALYRQFELLKAKLKAEGLFDEARKRRIPAFVSRVAVVTSRGAAALHDFTTTCRRRGPHVRIVFVHAAVQGDAAPLELARAIASAGGSNVDVVVVARGGGSIEDLWAFNTEPVARAIAACAKPVISAVGHETDFTIADFVADVRAATPTAAAELVASERSVLLASIASAENRLRRSLLRLTRALLDRQARSRDSLQRSCQSLLAYRAQRIDDLGAQLERCNPLRRLDAFERRWSSAVVRLSAAGSWAVVEGSRRLGQADGRLYNSAEGMLTRLRGKLAVASAKLETLAPEHTLQRGYAIVYGLGGRLVTSYTHVRPSDPIHITLSDGRIDAAVTGRKDANGKDAA